MNYVVICSIAFLASGLTFFSGFGLGTLLLPAFAVFFPIERAVALTGVVHFLNGAFKLVLVWRHIDRQVLLRFGVLAILGAFAGALALAALSDIEPLWSYRLFGRDWHITPVKVTVGTLLLLFAAIEGAANPGKVNFSPRYLPLGGVLSGFFGGLAGMQGALRSAFLVRAGLSKEAYVATGAAIAFAIDATRLSVYAKSLLGHGAHFDYTLLTAAVFSAFLGAALGNRYLSKVALSGIRRLVGSLLVLVAAGLIAGVL